MGESQDFKIPQLRNAYQKTNFTRTPGAQSIGGFGFVHDGMDPDLITFLSRPVFDDFARPESAQIRSNVNAFVMCFDTGIAPAAGYARTFTAANVNSASLSNDWTLLEQQANTVTNRFLNTTNVVQVNVNLVVKGTLNGLQRGFVYQPTSNNYRADSTNVPAMTRAQLRAKILAGDTLTIMGVPIGSGTRLGIDRNEDGVLDGDAPRPALRIAQANNNTAVIAWSTNANNYVLEAAGALPAANWNAETSVRAVLAGDFTVTNSPAVTNRFFRLREL